MHRDVASVAQGSPESGTHGVEMIRVFKVAKDSALKARTQTINQMMALVVTALADLRGALEGLTASELARRYAGLRPGDVVTPAAAAKLALRSIARRHRQRAMLGSRLRGCVRRFPDRRSTLVGTTRAELSVLVLSVLGAWWLSKFVHTGSTGFRLFGSWAIAPSVNGSVCRLLSSS